MSCINCCKAVKKAAKKVTFCETSRIIYFEKIADNKGVCWQRVAQDRMRFKRRIIDVEQRIRWVFTPQHRSRIYSMLYL